MFNKANFIDWHRALREQPFLNGDEMVQRTKQDGFTPHLVFEMFSLPSQAVPLNNGGVVTMLIRAGIAWLVVLTIAAGDSAIAGRLEQPPDPVIQSSIQAVLQQYSIAFESLDAGAVKKVQPSIDVENLKTAFKEMRALEVKIDEIKILSIDVGVVRVNCRVTQTLTPKAGTQKTIAVMRVIRLRRPGSVWIIDAFER